MHMTHPIRFLFFALFLLLVSTASLAQVSIGISVGFPPPALPVYEQPICPGEGYIWTPGYWAWDREDEEYYWVPGTWVVAPEVGYLWTPGWWGWREGAYVFHEGYWGPFVGFYGGVNYGYGYFGHGYEGGRWDRDRFYYNTRVNNINVTQIHNTYNTTVINNNTTINRVSYNGGNGGINARPTREEEEFARERHVAPMVAQTQHAEEARDNRELRASVNHGRPPVAATTRPGEFRDRGAVPAREAGGRYEPPANRGANVARPGIHPNDRPPHERLPVPNTGSPRVDQKYQQQQEKLYAKQDQEHLRLQQKQEQDHQRLVQQRANDAGRQQVERRHQQQTQQLEQRHTQQLQQVQQRQQPPRESQSRPGHP